VEGPVGHDDTVVELVVRPPALRRALESILWIFDYEFIDQFRQKFIYWTFWKFKSIVRKSEIRQHYTYIDICMFD
jgi:hypothetical protein